MEPTVPFYAAEFVAVLPGHEQPTTPGSLQGQKRDQRSCNAEGSKRKIGTPFIPALGKQRQADLYVFEAILVSVASSRPVKVTQGMTYGISPHQ